MEKEEKGVCCDPKKQWRGDGGGGAVYFFGMVGTAVYFIGHAATFWMGVLGFLKALVWPAFLTYELFKFLLG